MRTLYVTDLDGTLLDKTNRISEYSLDIINNLINSGMDFTYATARSFSFASVVTKSLITNIPVIIYNGTFMIDPATGEILSSNIFDSTQRQKIIKLLKQNKIYPLVYAYVDGIEKVSWLRSEENYGFKRYISLRKGDKRLNPISNIEDLHKGDIFYFTCIGTKEELLPIYDFLKNDSNVNCTLRQELYCEDYWCEIMHENATKANAVSRLKDILGYDKIISFGDAINDVPMFYVSDECYAVKNAVPELKDISTGIIGSNEANGVARWLEDHTKSIKDESYKDF